MAIIYPQLDGVKINEDRSLPTALVQAIRKAYDYISQSNTASVNAAPLIEDLHVNRVLYPAADMPLGSLYLETDRGLLYVNRFVVSANAWTYLSGVYPRTQAQITGITGLTVADNGLRLAVTDYAHMLMWTAPGWGWAPEDPKNAGQIAFFDFAPGIGWKLVDGLGDSGVAISAVNPIKILKSDGTIRNNTTAGIMTAHIHIRGAATYNGTPTAAVLPTFAGSALPVHQHEETVVAAGTALYGANSPFGTGPNLTSALVINATASSLVGNYSLTGFASGGTPAGTIGLPDDPVGHVDALPYIRK